MSEPKKYDFSRTFETGGRSPFVQRVSEPSMTFAQHEAKLKEAEAHAFLRGHVEGQTAARHEEQARLARAIETLSSAMRDTAASFAAIEQVASEEALQFALKFATILAGQLVTANPVGPIEEAARKVFGDLRGVPHIAVRVSPDLLESTKSSLSEIARSIGLEAKIIVMAEPEIAMGDCRVEWGDGGIVRNAAELEAKIAAAIRNALGHAESGV
jgi:flagellar assembly protein FliH